ncbi:sulfotransferase domain-containing protein [uncultured Roseobacter sp.]|uniref:sulfotransferase domain-containing protein n=1 Tax=uncultured Roseobacter sp. TaxID=114847 RepID=UPI002603416E|nr:sulfotransferase domain-containing protein [uncultured Roseobacter sp.]
MTAEELEFLSRLRHRPEGVMCVLGKQALADFQVFGERSSGTNAVEWLIKENTNLDPVKSYGWKHGFPVALAYHPASLIVLIVRDPIDWVVSMFNNPHAAHKDVNTRDFSAFIRGEWAMFVRPRIDRFWKRPWQMTVRSDVGGQECVFDRDPITGRRFRNVMQMRYAKLSSMLSIRNRETNFCLVKFEDLISDPRPFLQSIRCATAQRPVANFKLLPTDPLNPKGKPAERAMKRDDISEEDYNYLLQELDAETENALGYL